MRGKLLIRLSVMPVRADLLGATLQYRQGAHSRRKRLLRWLDASLAVNVAATQLNGVDSERLSQSRYHHFGGELSLWSTKATKCSTGDVVGIDSVTIDVDIGDLIAAGGKQRGGFDHLNAG